jgi:hypothetical protein
MRRKQTDGRASTPSWAVELAVSLLKGGLDVGRIEERLVARGLNSEAAAAVMDRACAEQVRQEEEPQRRAARRMLVHRLLSGLVAFGYVLLAYRGGGPALAFRVSIGLLLPLACIWFGDEMGARTSYRITSPTPGFLVRWGGWVVLLMPVVVMLFRM